MENKQLKFITNRLIVAVLFVLWGVMWFVFDTSNMPGNALKMLFIVVGVIHLYTSGKELIKYKNTGEVKNRIDERGEINNLRASRRGFNFFIIGFSVMFGLRGVNVLNEQVFVALSGPVIAVGVMIYFVSYYIFERKG